MNNNTPLVSVVLCTYMGQKYLPIQLDSVLNQTYKNLEVLIFDDVSTDETITILKDYETKHANIKISVNAHNLGYVKNFEQGIKMANGSYIALCDQDDIWDLNKIELQVAAIKDNLLVYHNSAFIDDNGVSLNKCMSDIYNMYEGNSWEQFLLYNCVSGHSVLMKKELAKLVMPLDPKQHHDQQIAFIASIYGSIAYINLPLVKYRQHEASFTDILSIKKDDEKSIKHTHDLILWLKFCETKKAIIKTNAAIISRLLYFTECKKETYFRFSEFLFLLKYYDKLLFIKKKGSLSKFNIILKKIWGIKTKKLWRKFLRPDRINVKEY